MAAARRLRRAGKAARLPGVLQQSSARAEGAAIFVRGDMAVLPSSIA
jgi:hypothetical protein